jgi:PAS domain S-box-containing protein
VDIGRNKQQQQQQQIRRLATVVRDSNDAITIQDFEGNILSWNRGAELMYGYNEKEALQMSIDLLTRTDKVAEQKEFTRRLIAGEKITSFETQRVTKDGRILDVWLTVTKVLDDDGKPVGIASTERDVTERNKQQQRRQQQHELITKLNEDLARSNKELERFANIASHDLQAPLRTMTSFIELLARRYKGKLDTQADEFIEYIVKDALRMQALIESLLELTRVDTACGMLIETDSASALRAALDNLRSAIDSSGAIITSNDMPVLVADVSQLTQIFQNLIDNGIKFRRNEKPHINISARREGAAWLFAVADNGIGVEPQYVDDVLQMTRKLVLRDKYPGSGVGLSICKKIVERHGGRIWMESIFGKGSTFYFTIPVKTGGTHV